MDLNLLVALKALLEEQHVSHAAEKIGLSQPAMSRALGRLRHCFQDPLLVRSHKGFSLTARAESLIIPLNDILFELQLIFRPAGFNLSTLADTLRIATRDYEMVTLLPALIPRVNAQAPNLKISAQALVGDTLEVLEKHEVDFVISATESHSSHIVRTKLFEDDFVCVAALNHPLLKDTMTLEQYVQSKHVLVTLTGAGPGFIDDLLEKQKLSREVCVRVPHFLTAAHIVADSNLLVTMPRRMSESLKGLPVQCLEMPLPIPHLTIYLHWHTRHQKSALHRWVKEQIYTSANDVYS